MTELKKPSAEHQQLAIEWARQFTSGERDAGFWQWYSNEITLSNSPNFKGESVYRYEPASAHPHYAKWKEWGELKSEGAVARGEYELVELVGPRNAVVCAVYPDCSESARWIIGLGYEIRKTEKHPDNLKLKLRLLEWKQVPVGTMTNYGQIRFIGPNVCYVENSATLTLFQRKFLDLRIESSSKWTAIQDNELAPTCEGLVIEYRGLGGDDCTGSSTNLSMIACVNAYRVIGIREGWTDDPAKAGV